MTRSFLLTLHLCCCSPDRVQVVVVNNTPLFFSHRDGPWFPTLRLLHQYPDMMAKLRVDQGAIRFVLSGANIMCPGLTSPGATIHDEVWGRSACAVMSSRKDSTFLHSVPVVDLGCVRANSSLAATLGKCCSWHLCPCWALAQHAGGR